MSLSTFVSLYLASFAVAVPVPQFGRPGPPGRPPFIPGRPGGPPRSCSLANVRVTIPAGLTAQTGAPSSVLLGVGFQNYTCSDAGTYTAVGAVADLYDLACIAGNARQLTGAVDAAQRAWLAAPPPVRSLGNSALGHPLSGKHFFISSGTGISPVWDNRAVSQVGNANAFVLASRANGIKTVNPERNVDLLELNNVSGGLADKLYRLETRGGQPPTSCTPGSAPLSVKYSSHYIMFGGSAAPGAIQVDTPLVPDSPILVPDTPIAGPLVPDTPLVPDSPIAGPLVPDTPLVPDSPIAGPLVPDTPLVPDSPIAGPLVPDTPITRPPLVPDTPITRPPLVPDTPITRPPLVPDTPIARPPLVPDTPITRPPLVPDTPIARPPLVPDSPILVPDTPIAGPLVPDTPITRPPLVPDTPIARPPLVPDTPIARPPLVPDTPLVADSPILVPDTPIAGRLVPDSPLRKRRL